MRHIHTVEESGLQVDTGAFWKGKRKGSTASTTSHKVYVHLSHGCPQRVSEIITLSIRVRHPTKFTPRPEDLTHLNIDKLAETPRSIADCIIGRANTVECLAIQAGFITQEQMLSITQNGTPRRLTTKLATTLQRTCLELAYTTWLHRNETPDKAVTAADAQHRMSRPQGRRGIILIDTTDTENQRTTQWEKERQLSLGRKDGWRHWSQGASPTATKRITLKGKRKRATVSINTPTQQRNIMFTLNLPRWPTIFSLSSTFSARWHRCSEITIS